MRRLDWSNERYVRLHTRDTPAWALLGYETQCLWMQLLRKMDRAGVIPLDDDEPPYVCIAAMLPGSNPDHIEAQLETILSKGWLVHDEEHNCLVDAEFIEREEAPMTDAQRKRESRRRRRDRASASRFVTESSGKRTEPSQAVTSGHDRSQGVTPFRSVPCLAVPADSCPAPAEPATGPPKEVIADARDQGRDRRAGALRPDEGADTTPPGGQVRLPGADREEGVPDGSGLRPHAVDAEPARPDKFPAGGVASPPAGDNGAKKPTPAQVRDQLLGELATFPGLEDAQELWIHRISCINTNKRPTPTRQQGQIKKLLKGIRGQNGKPPIHTPAEARLLIELAAEKGWGGIQWSWLETHDRSPPGRGPRIRVETDEATRKLREERGRAPIPQADYGDVDIGDSPF